MTRGPSLAASATLASSAVAGPLTARTSSRRACRRTAFGSIENAALLASSSTIVVMYKPLADLEDLNRSARVELTRNLADRYNVRVAGTPGERLGEGSLGLSFYFAFD